MVMILEFFNLCLRGSKGCVLTEKELFRRMITWIMKKIYILSDFKTVFGIAL